ncbi:hypothetical protein BMETH_1605_0 [methanotrophic bacterial endosymbiont of Bathymodiolus sp.]|nr:hypothetical protein BMETH_1605_0 [methanotrophic bacterial endosymbiont of Bathymodiolus sp.]
MRTGLFLPTTTNAVLLHAQVPMSLPMSKHDSNLVFLFQVSRQYQR